MSPRTDELDSSLRGYRGQAGGYPRGLAVKKPKRMWCGAGEYEAQEFTGTACLRMLAVVLRNEVALLSPLVG